MWMASRGSGRLNPTNHAASPANPNTNRANPNRGKVFAASYTRTAVAATTTTTPTPTTTTHQATKSILSPPPVSDQRSGGGGEGGASGASGESGESGGGGICRNYRLDMMAAEFGACKCGRKKTDHAMY
jgi:hypothetical protein